MSDPDDLVIGRAYWLVDPENPPEFVIREAILQAKSCLKLGFAKPNGYSFKCDRNNVVLFDDRGEAVKYALRCLENRRFDASFRLKQVESRIEYLTEPPAAGEPSTSKGE